jgi:hypothetical protein
MQYIAHRLMFQVREQLIKIDEIEIHSACKIMVRAVATTHFDITPSTDSQQMTVVIMGITVVL